MAEPIFKTIDFKSDIKSAKVSHDGSVVIQFGDDEADGQIDLLDQEGEDDGE